MKWENDTFGLVLRMRQMVYSSKDFNVVDFCRDSTKYASIMAFAAPKVESLWFLYQAEGLPKNISIEEFLDKPSEQVRALHKARSSCVPLVASERSSSGFPNFRQMVPQDA